MEDFVSAMKWPDFIPRPVTISTLPPVDDFDAPLRK